MSPAKATRPGFRHSLGSAVDPQRADQPVINLFHPIYHSFTVPVGCRIDIERALPTTLDDADEEELIDNFSEPPNWLERFSPLAVQVGDQVFRGKNAAELMLKIYRLMFDLFHGLGHFIETTLTQNTGDSIRFPFLSLCVDPDTMHRLIETDYESGEAAYTNLIKLYSQGTAAPCLATPFHAMLTHLDSDAEVRLCIRAGLIFYLRVLKVYSGFLERHGENGLMVLPFWLNEGAYSRRVVRILEEEVQALCKKEKLGIPHLVLLLDNHQACCNENDVLMKSWNQLAPEKGADGSGRNGNGHGNGRGGRAMREKLADLHPGVHGVSVLFRDRTFSDWVIHANPSVKKLLDRTIAKVDSDINAQNVHYGWAHFEELEAISYNPRAIINFQQKLIKLTELGYLPLSPDFFVRGKLRGEFGTTRHEPHPVCVNDNSAGQGWEIENSRNLGRWLGYHQEVEDGQPTEKTVLDGRPYQRNTAEGKVTVEGHPCWKIAWHEVRRRCSQAVIGDLATLDGGMAEVLGRLTGQHGKEKSSANVQDFLANYTYVYWREHFIQHDLAEADINVLELTNKYLRAGVKSQLGAEDAALAGTAAQAVYFALDSARSTGVGWENMDQRAFYQNVVLLTLALCNTMYVYHWLGDTKTARKQLALIKTELLDFEGAYDRYKLASHGVTKKAWQECLKSEIHNSRDNVVRRAALRIAARQLRPLGYTKDFTRQDANLTTDVGHLWSHETSREFYVYENPLFCGLNEA